MLQSPIELNSNVPLAIGVSIISAAFWRIKERDLTLAASIPKKRSKIRATLVSSTAAGCPYA
ncbi:MAG TPA: hypothetical protein V6C71_17965 [Coleofasciculaceae cyanobacterium]